MISGRRCCSGTRMMSLSRSWPTGDEVCDDRQQVLAGAGLALRDLRQLGRGRRSPPRAWVGEHSTNCSPISDCRPTRQVASLRNGMNAGSSIFSTTTARLWLSTSSASIVPTLTPAIFTSSPVMTKLELSKIARTR